MHQWLVEAECDLLQGYYFGKPMPLEELGVWYKSHKTRWGESTATALTK